MVGLNSDHHRKFQDEKELQALFNRLDVNKDGKICIADIVHTLEEYHGTKDIELSSEIAKSFLRRCGVEVHGCITFKEFTDYVLEHDRRLVISFDQLDKNKLGLITTENIQETFKQLNIPLERKEAEDLLRKIDQKGNLNIDYGEWRQFFLFHPAEHPTRVFKYWQAMSCLDVSGDAAVGLPKDVDLSYMAVGRERQLLQLTAGAVAGATSRTCTAPIDRLKLMRQVHGYKHKSSDFVQAYKYMIREGGFLSLWRGNGINVLKMAPETALKYGAYEHYKRMLTSSDNGGISQLLSDRQQLTRFIAGSLAGSTAQTFIYPMEVLKTRMCLRKTGQFHSVWDCARSIYEQHGLLAFYRGYFVNLLGIIPYAGMELALYEKCKATYINHFMSEVNSDPHQHPPTYLIPLFASLSASCGIVVTYPLSLVRAKLQATYWSHSRQEKITAVNLFRTIWLDDGVYGLYRGMFTNIMKVLPAVSISMASYEALRRKFNLGPLGSG